MPDFNREGFLRERRIFAELFTKNIPPEVLEKKPFRILNRGFQLLKQDTPAENVFCVCRGRLRIYDELTDGNLNRVVWALPGETIGELECLANHEISSFSAEVFEDNTILMQISREDFVNWIHKDHDFSIIIARILAVKLYNASKTLCYSITHDADTLVRKFIIDLTEPQIMNKSEALLFNTRADIANNCCVGERTVNRVIKKLKEQDLISVSRGKIKVEYQQLKKLKELDKMMEGI